MTAHTPEVENEYLDSDGPAPVRRIVKSVMLSYAPCHNFVRPMFNMRYYAAAIAHPLMFGLSI